MLRVHNLVVSLDGFATGEGQSREAGFGHAQQVFGEWFGKLRIWRGMQPDGNFGPDEAIASAWGTGIGAEIMGRNKFRPTEGPWPEDGWPTTINEFLRAGLVDYLHVVLVPIVLGRGVRLWDGLEGLHERYALETVTVPSGATHLFFTR